MNNSEKNTDNVVKDFYTEMDEGGVDLTKIEGLMRDFTGSEFESNKIPENAPASPQHAYVAKKLALETDDYFDKKIEWQHYWFRCCISEKCDYIFRILKTKGVDREDDLRKICNPKSVLWEKLGDSQMQQYVDNYIDFFLKRYNWFGACCLWNKNPPKLNKNLVKLALPRLLAAILVGFFFIATSSEIWDFATTIQSNCMLYSASILFIFGMSIGYLLFECNRKVETHLSIKEYFNRVGPVFSIGIFCSILFSCLFTSAGFLGPGAWCNLRVFFYATLAFLVGIIIQLLWEEKGVTEPF